MVELTGYESERGTGDELHQHVPAAGPHQGEGHLTTNQGIRIADNQNQLKTGERGPVLLEDFVLREKIFHFDHERIPERIVHARGSAAHGYFELTESLSDITRADLFQRAGREDARVRALLDGRGRRRLRRHAPRRARLRGEVLYEGGQLGSRRQQYPGLLHPGRDQVPRPHPRREDGGGPRLSAGRDRARHVLGLHRPDAGIDAHGDVGHVRPDPAALLRDDARVSASTRSGS